MEIKLIETSGFVSCFNTLRKPHKLENRSETAFSIASPKEPVTGFQVISIASSISIDAKDLELLKKDINELLTLNWNQLVLKINSYQKNEIISKFLRTNNKEGLYDFIRSRLEKDKMLVILNSLEREM